jgi:aminoglycoside phosphotransferase (APT) family kinase protein
MNKPYEQCTKINKGWSNDEKYLVKHNGEDYLLRVSPIELLPRIESLLNISKELDYLDIPISKPIEIFKKDKKIHVLYNWIQGSDMSDVIGNYSKQDQYQYGLDAGVYLKRIHSIKAPDSIEPWEMRFNRKIDRNIKRYQESILDIPETQMLIDYLESNRYLLKNRPQCFQHGDYHIANFMINNEHKLVIIDFDRYDYGDPWEEFNRIVWSVASSPVFASGIIDGYFDYNVPEEFWRLLLLYIASNAMSSLTWALKLNEKELEVMINQMHDILNWYDNFTRIIPKWYGTKKNID